MTCDKHADHIGPGKFEGASCAVFAFYDQDADRSEELASGGYWQEFTLRPSDRDEWPELAEQDTLRIYTESSGFVYEVSWEPTPDSLAYDEFNDGAGADDDADELERLAIEQAA